MASPIKLLPALGTIAVAWGLYYFLTKETTTTKVIKKKKKKITLSSLTKKHDEIISSTSDPRLAIVLLENLQLEVDGIESTTEKRRQRRKKLNARIQESIAHLEAESKVQPEQNDMKGYRITKDGKKTTFFHRDMDEKTKELIGDNAPQRIHTTNEGTKKNDTTGQSSDKGSDKGSEWNNGSTWESKNYTREAKKLVREMLSSLSISKINGDVTLVMKKKLCLIYDLEIVFVNQNKETAKICLLSGDAPELVGVSKSEKEDLLETLNDFETRLLNTYSKNSS